ncbi:mitochondrial carrier [Metschnikowia bicuspidata var. bicuspidata NRRL YB-4993]|uniref:Mitochondrial carrier n=1 Tax=Metschnikowia bicuspidata var. bicuspidata NRRL YB-4993 TaxID=869754 RepID=A0A1A0HJ60_9ASCO|nr:mitochondrial carrier [Metschnikowia bicuspidata var. bicuspidata NRRL YB-4993]OBA24036.1 mitochondrial carrier [Metschnikowia bicuspidata var. bicuspidata NRRL YB-4993]
MAMSSELGAAIEDENLHFSLRDAASFRQPGQISAVQKMISACLGSLVTSFAVTPFDVVRIRIQQQEIMQTDRNCCKAPSVAPASAARSVTSTPPGVFWINKPYCESSKTCPKITSTFQGMVVISRNEGLSVLWRGLSLTLLMAIPSNIIYFTGYEYIKDISPLRDHPLNYLLCGMFARTMSATVVSPIELLKTRLQSIPSDSHGNNPRSKLISSLLKDSAAAFKKNGYGSMFTGLQITLWRDVPFLGIYWLCYEFFKERFSASLGVDFDNNHVKQDDWKVFATSFVSGSLSGVISAFFTNPFDVGKTRLQIATQKEPKTKASMFQFLSHIYKIEGAGALYSGFAPRVMKIAPLCAIMISSYEIGKKIFKDNL